MIKVRLLKESLLNEVSIRYYTERFKFPQEFAELFNSKHRVVGDALAAIFVEFIGSNDPKEAEYIKDPNMSEEDKVKKLKYDYDDFVQNGDAEKLDKFLTRFPRKKDVLVNAAKQNMKDFYDYFDDLYEEEFGSEQIERDKKGTVLKFEDGFYWTNLGKSFCDLEAKRMRHCGQATHGDGILFSLRDEENKPYVTIEKSKNSKSIYQIKGPANSFAGKKYWSYVYNFFDKFGITQMDIEERFALSNKEFMEYFNSTGDENYEEDLDNFERMQLAIYRAETYDSRQEVIYNFYERFKKMIQTYAFRDLRVDQTLDMFYVLYLGLYKYQKSHLIIEKFLTEYIKHNAKPIEYDLELCEQIVDYVKKDGKLDGETAEYILDIIKYDLKIIDRMAEAENISKTLAERFLMSRFPFMSKLEKIASSSDEDVQRESLFRMNKKGHFEYVKG